MRENKENLCNNMWTRKEKRTWLWVLVAGTSAVYASRTSFPLLIPAVAKEKDWHKADSGAVLSSFFWGYTMTQVAGGYLADKLGGHKIIFLAAIGWSALTLVMPLILQMVPGNDMGITIVIISRIAHGAFQGAHFPGMSSLASRQLSEKDRASFFSIATSGSAFGTLLTGLFGSYILETFGWQAVFYVIGLFCCTWSFIFYHLCSNFQNNKQHFVTECDVTKVPWVVLFKKPAFWSCVVAHACQNNCFFTLLSWLPTYFHDVYPEAKGWVVNMVPWLFTVPCTLLGKYLSEKLLSSGFSITTTRKIVEALCLLTEAGALLLLDNVESLYGALTCIVLVVGATGFHNCSVVVNPGDLAPNHAGSVFGLMNTVGSIPGFLGVYAAGHLLETTNSWSTVFNYIAVVNVVGFAMFTWFASGNPII